MAETKVYKNNNWEKSWGGGGLVSDRRTTAQTCAAGLNVTVAQIQNLDPDGVYIASGFVNYKPSSSGGVYPRLCLTGSSANHIYYDNACSWSTDAKNQSISGVVTGYSEYKLVFNIAGGGTVNEAFLQLIRIK